MKLKILNFYFNENKLFCSTIDLNYCRHITNKEFVNLSLCFSGYTFFIIFIMKFKNVSLYIYINTTSSRQQLQYHNYCIFYILILGDCKNIVIIRSGDSLQTSTSSCIHISCICHLVYLIHILIRFSSAALLRLSSKKNSSPADVDPLFFTANYDLRQIP